jgi:hypothetical protein
VLALRIGTVKNSRNFLRVVGPARAMSAGAEKESTETTVSSESDIGVRGYGKASPFDQSYKGLCRTNVMHVLAKNCDFGNYLA